MAVATKRKEENRDSGKSRWTKRGYVEKQCHEMKKQNNTKIERNKRNQQFNTWFVTRVQARFNSNLSIW